MFCKGLAGVTFHRRIFVPEQGELEACTRKKWELEFEDLRLDFKGMLICHFRQALVIFVWIALNHGLEASESQSFLYREIQKGYCNDIGPY